MSEEKKQEIKNHVIDIFNSGLTDVHLIRAKIQYEIYWTNVTPTEYYTNDEIYSIVVETINELNDVQ